MFTNFRRQKSKQTKRTLSAQDDNDFVTLMTDLYKNQIVNLHRFSQATELLIISNEMYQESMSISKMTLEEYGKWTLEILSTHWNSNGIRQIGVQTLRELRTREMFSHNLKKKTLEWVEKYKGDGWDEIIGYAALSCAEADKDMLEKLCSSFIIRFNQEMIDPELINIPDQISHWDVLRFLAENRTTGAKMCLELTEIDGLKLLSKSFAQYAITPEEYPMLKILNVCKATCTWRPYYIRRLLKDNYFFKQFRQILPTILQSEHVDEVRMTILVEAYLDFIIYLSRSKMSRKIFGTIDFLTSVSAALLVVKKRESIGPFCLYVFVTIIVIFSSFGDPVFSRSALELICSGTQNQELNFGKGYYTLYFLSWTSQYKEYLYEFLEQHPKTMNQFDTLPEVETAIKFTREILEKLTP